MTPGYVSQPFPSLGFLIVDSTYNQDGSNKFILISLIQSEEDIEMPFQAQKREDLSLVSGQVCPYLAHTV